MAPAKLGLKSVEAALAIPNGAPLAHLLREPHIDTDQMLTGPGEGGADVGSPLRIAFTIISARGTRMSPG